jgi:hypothetical protein
MKADLLEIVKLAAQHLNCAEEGHAEVLADVEALRAELDGFRRRSAPRSASRSSA